MVLLPSFVLVFDATALLPGTEREWQEFSRLGECFVPEGVLEQMRSLSDHAPEPDIEAKARAFGRFFPTSGWQKTDAIAEHPLLQPSEGHTLSKRARLALEVLECAYGVARRHPDGLVILIANDQPMLQRLLSLKATNLCGIPLTALIQWSRSQRRPPAVSHHLQLMRSGVGAERATATSRSASAASSATSRISVRPAAPRPTVPARATIAPASSRAGSRSPQSSQSRQSAQLKTRLYTLVGWAIAAVAIAIVWRILSPASFDQIWQQLPFVSHPTQKMAPSKK